jgi:predicted amidohydrolase
MAQVKVAAIQAKAEEFASDDEFHQKIQDLTGRAVAAGAQILVFPEDIGLWLELAHKGPRVKELRSVSSLISVANLSESEATPAAIPPMLRSNAWAERVLDKLTDWLFRHVHVPAFGDWLSESRIGETYQAAFSAAAKQYGVPIVAGSIYEKRADGIYNTCYVFDKDGSVAGKADKRHLIPLEESFGVKEGQAVHVIETQDYKIGACICYDLYGPDVTQQLAAQGAQLICAGSTGLRPWPHFPYVPAVDAPQIERAKETGLAIARAYQCGWLVPGIYMDGLSDIVLPDGTIAVQSYPNMCSTEDILVAEVPLK